MRTYFYSIKPSLDVLTVAKGGFCDSEYAKEHKSVYILVVSAGVIRLQQIQMLYNVLERLKAICLCALAFLLELEKNSIYKFAASNVSE